MGKRAGGVAQLGARLNGIQKVAGSNPAASTQQGSPQQPVTVSLLCSPGLVPPATSLGQEHGREHGPVDFMATSEPNQEINMQGADEARDQDDPFDLARFTTAQEGVYTRALAEIRAGDKRSHWMWFIFPQIDGLGVSSTAKHYAIKSAEEARQYLSHPVLGPRLLECAEAVLAVEGRSASEIFGSPDDLKLNSCMTLFESVAGRDTVFGRVLDKYYQGERDTKSQEILAAMKKR
jgi:uncharacterized protein (DUF1810 family)